MALEMDQFHEVYFAESFELLDAMEAALLRLSPGDADVETVNTIFRVAHSIKGGAGMFGFNEIASFTHTLETLLDELRCGRMQVTAAMSDGLLRSVDVIRAMLTSQQKQQPLDLSVSRVLQEEFRAVVAANAPPGDAADASTATEAAPAAAAPAPVPAAPTPAPPVATAATGVPSWHDVCSLALTEVRG